METEIEKKIKEALKNNKVTLLYFYFIRQGS